MAKLSTLTFHRSQLLYDISNAAWVESDVMKPEEEDGKHLTADITQQGNVDRITRTLDLAFSECVEILYPYSRRMVQDGEEKDDAFTETESYRMELSLPDAFSSTTTDLLKNLIHEYLVSRALADWLSITAPKRAAAWREKAENAHSQISSSLHRRLKRVRRPLNPF